MISTRTTTTFLSCCLALLASFIVDTSTAFIVDTKAFGRTGELHRVDTASSFSSLHTWPRPHGTTSKILPLYSTTPRTSSTSKSKPTPLTTTPPNHVLFSNSTSTTSTAVAGSDSDKNLDALRVINDFNFHTMLTSDKPILVDICSKNCGPCKLIEPTLQKFAADYNDICQVAKFDIHDRLSQQFKVELLLSGHMPQALPTLLLFHKGQVLTRWRGIIRYEQLQTMMVEHVNELQSNIDSEDENNKMMPQKAGLSSLGYKYERDDSMLTDD